METPDILYLEDYERDCVRIVSTDTLKAIKNDEDALVLLAHGFAVANLIANTAHQRNESVEDERKEVIALTHLFMDRLYERIENELGED